MSKRSHPLYTEEVNLIREVEAFIQTAFPSIHTREDIVNQFNAYQNKHFLSTVFLRQHFTTVCKMPPMKYVCQLRLKKSIEMLLDHDTNFSIKMIAQEVGLTYTGFINFFKKHKKVPPDKFRLANWKDIPPE